MNNSKTPTAGEQCFCQSYYDDQDILQDCTCGKCQTPEERILEKMPTESITKKIFHCKKCEDLMRMYIRKSLKAHRKEVIAEKDKEIQKLQKELNDLYEKLDHLPIDIDDL